MNEQNGLICAYMLDGKGGGREVGWSQVRDWSPDAGHIWVHLDRKHPGSNRWLKEEAGLDPLACEALLAEETRPRDLVIGDGLLVILRGVNLNSGADPEDMISIRVWVDSGRVITLRSPRLRAVQDIRDSIFAGTGPTSPGDFLVQLTTKLTDRTGPVVEDLDDQVDRLEEEVVEAQSHELRFKLSTLRRQGIVLRRYLAPQRDVMSRLQTERVPWLSDLHRARLREVSDRLLRYVEDLDAARERAAVTQEELANRLSEQMNKTMYVLSVVAGIFLPLGLLTGLLGINVGGIPGTENHWAFAVVCAILVILAVFVAWLFRRFRFF